ncbi:MAG: metallophosphoesterase [Pseudomonadota bacterium]
MSLRLLQISDCHLSHQPDQPYREQQPDANLAQLTRAIEAFDADQLIVTGDLSEDGSYESYARLIDWLLVFKTPVAWLPGNHDSLEVMAPMLRAAGFDSGPLLALGGWQLALLNSAWAGRPEGELDAERLAILTSLAATRPCGVLVHHQPVPVSDWIDRVALIRPKKFWQAIAQQPSVRWVAFGHVHQRFRSQQMLSETRTVECLAAPSTAANSLPGTHRFELDVSGPMVRWFVLEPDGRYRTGLLSAGP